MRALTFTLSVTVILLSGCHRDSSKVRVVPLSFYVVSEGKVEGGRFIDAPNFPKLGYIAAVPDLVITRLETVTLFTSEPHSREWPALSIVLRSGDAPQFTALTERAVGKKLLLMLGDSPLTAPMVVERIPAASLMLTFGKGTDSEKLIGGLKKLVH